MISRHWKGIAKRERAAEYVHHLRTDTFKQLEKIPGFISTRILKREIEDGIEFQLITEWTGIEAIKHFAGENFDTAVVPKTAGDDPKAVHFEVV